MKLGRYAQGVWRCHRMTRGRQVEHSSLSYRCAIPIKAASDGLNGWSRPSGMTNMAVVVVGATHTCPGTVARAYVCPLCVLMRCRTSMSPIHAVEK